ncbi:Spy/CpxP family protein refolding chaperone [Rhodopila sp.]|uniref:Spy/CpxP family protein refolding chaperone n=1 Tax=Rhodopila sp. TaxID=2480087 RepID=UPI003D0D774D
MKTFALLATLSLAATPAFAQTPAQTPAPSQTPAPATRAPSSGTARPASKESQVDQRITQMHRRLKITPQQEPAWKAFAQTMRDNATSTDQAYKDRRASIATMSAEQNMQNFAQIVQARAQGVQNLSVSFQTLYDAMSDSQKQAADNLFRHYADRAEARKQAPK